ncbi:serine carboxypeptidase-like 18 isoform X3 [Camellia sinensis]|nr:serine carboxypeptidase-like 18 isoform X3 [Camellia sinensis]
MDDVQLFYYFVESQRNPAQDPLMLWLTGGPGCSCLTAFFYESGPVYFEFEGYKGGLPTLRLNEYTWTQRANILYVDAPVGTGFSYSESQEGYYVDDYKSAKQIYEFLRKWLKSHPEFLENNLYIGGDSYSGIIVPMVVQEIIDGNELGRQPNMNLKGYILGNPVTDSYVDVNSRIPFAHRLTLISEDLYWAAKASCNGDYVNIDNEDCELNMEAIDELILDIKFAHVLEPYCGYASPRPHEGKWRQRSLKEHPKDPLRLQPIGPAYFCQDYLYVLSEIWANNETVQEALNVRSGTVGVWQRCNGSLAYTKDVTSTIAYHQNLTAASLRALIYSGDHDMSVPYIGTQQWINTLNLTLSNVWRAWFVDAQVAGYVRRFTKDNYALTYATVKGAGNLAPEYKQKECYTMIDRWFAYYPL